MSSEVEQAFADALGLEGTPETADSEAVQDFFSSAEAELSGGEEASPEHTGGGAETSQPQEWVHEPTGKTFDNELDYLRYNSGWTADRMGTENKELRERLDSLEAKKAETPEQNNGPVSREDLKKMLWPNASDDIRNDALSDHMLDGIDNALAIYGKQLEQRYAPMMDELQQLRQQFTEASLYQENGLSRSQEQKLAEKHSWLGQITDPQARVAAMKDLIQREGGPETASPKLADRIPQRKAEDHVEGSAPMLEPASPDVERDKKFESMGERDRLGVLRKMIRQDGTFLGYNPND